eukprot:3880990-Rhodomonas_salina.1
MVLGAFISLIVDSALYEVASNMLALLSCAAILSSPFHAHMHTFPLLKLSSPPYSTWSILADRRIKNLCDGLRRLPHGHRRSHRMARGSHAWRDRFTMALHGVHLLLHGLHLWHLLLPPRERLASPHGPL